MKSWLSCGCIDVESKVAHSFHVFEDSSKRLTLQCAKCRDGRHFAQPDRPWCQACESVGKSVAVRSHICGWSFKIDLVDLIHLTVQRSDDRASHLRKMQTADYVSVIQVDVSSFAQLSFTQLLFRIKSMLTSTPRDSRNASLDQFLKSRLLWITPAMQESFGKPENCKLLSELSRNFASGKCSAAEAKASLLISRGILKGHALAKALLLCIVNRFDRVSRGVSRQTMSRGDGVDPEALRELAFRLGNSVGAKAIFRDLGVHFAGIDKITFHSELLPTPFMADSEQLLHNVKASLDLMSISSGARNWMLLICKSEHLLAVRERKGRAILRGTFA